MNKSHAISLLGGSVKSTAIACRITGSAVTQWPEVLGASQIDRVQAALYRASMHFVPPVPSRQIDLPSSTELSAASLQLLA